MKKPITTEELFEKVKAILKKKGKLPAILDYSLATSRPFPITTCEIFWENDLVYGGSEGICLTVYVKYLGNKGWCMEELGTFKTLWIDEKAIHTMTDLLADFIIEGTAYVNAHLDDFTWEGASVYPINEKGEKEKHTYTYDTMEIAMHKKDTLLKKYPKVVVRNNVTRKEMVFGGQ